MLIDLLKSVVYGLTQGLTEFLPVSSSGHLVLLHDLWPLNVANALAFDVVLHFGTLIAVIFYFRHDLRAIAGSFFNKDRERRRLGIYLLLATAPAGLAGYFLNDLITGSFRSVLLVAFMLSLVAVLFILSERTGAGRLDLSGLKLTQALLIGLAQALALIPGTSRSGITIVAGIFLGLKREAAARFSFLLAIPVILGAVLAQTGQLVGLKSDYGELAIYAVGFFASFVAGWWAIRFFLRFISRNTLRPFAYYRFALAFIILVYFLALN